MAKNNNFNKGIFLTAAGSFWWGLIGVIYFKYISFAGHIEVVIHRSLWTTVIPIKMSLNGQVKSILFHIKTPYKRNGEDTFLIFT